ncbi:MAG: 2-isopropylmalate synthase, partial [Actinomycetaceae bacterium]|nr:2-isopropylmalate synthase [Actinomycetaceae bacterium]
TQGVDPMLDISNIDEIREVVEYCTRMDVGPRAPYAGDLVYTSFSGSHQDAIKKGFLDRDQKIEEAGGNENAVPWEIPYIPIDPKDVGRNYEAVVRVNSQSGKGGVAYLLASTRHLDLPRRMQVELSRIVQSHTDQHGGEVTANLLWHIFADEYLPYTSDEGLEQWGMYDLISTSLTHGGADGDESILTATVRENATGVEHTLTASGNGPIDAFVQAMKQLGEEVQVLDYAEHALSAGGDATAACYVECDIDGQVLWGCGIDPSTMRASFKAIISAINRARR